MQIAGWQVARCTQMAASARPGGAIAVVAGSGNNGGDAIVAARHLAAWGWQISVDVVADPTRWRLSALTDGFDELGIAVSVDVSGQSAISRLADGANIVVDGLLGTGLVA